MTTTKEQLLYSGTHPRIVFMGTPEFAVASLDALVRENFNIVGVVTAPDKPAGRGMKMNESAVKKYAIEKGLPVLQPEKLKSPEFIDGLKALQADLQVVVAFRMLPEIVWSMPPLGTINVHASLLPQYRGAAPINWAVINGEKQTGITTFKLVQEIDKGNILMQETISIGEEETAGELHDRLKLTGAELLVRTIMGLADGSLQELSQEALLRDQNSSVLMEKTSAQLNTDTLSSDATEHQNDAPETHVLKHAPKIFTETCRIDWEKNTEDIFNLVRGLSPFPGAFTIMDGKILKIYSAKKEIVPVAEAPGDLVTDKKTFLKFACKNGYLHVTDIQPEGKKRMKTEDFLRGYRFMP